MSKGTKIKRSRASRIAAALIDSLPAGLVTVVGGSIRRGRQLVGDVDLAIGYKSARAAQRLNDLLGERFGYLRTKPDRARRFFDFRGVRINIWDVPVKQLGPAVLFVTGSGQFNMAMRVVAKRQGLLLNQYGLFHRKDRMPALSELANEEALFDRLGLTYVEPADRDESWFAEWNQ